MQRGVRPHFQRNGDMDYFSVGGFGNSTSLKKSIGSTDQDTRPIELNGAKPTTRKLR
jgi:hypothetical protein